MLHEEGAHRRAIEDLAEKAADLQTRVNEFIGLATTVDVELPPALYETNAELLHLLHKLREVAERRDESAACRDGTGEACQEANIDAG